MGSQTHGNTENVWLVRFKKSVPAEYLHRLDVLDELLCWGWVDCLARKLDDERTMQLISPRRQQKWSKSYKDLVDLLQAARHLEGPGVATVATFKALGSGTPTSRSTSFKSPTICARHSTCSRKPFCFRCVCTVVSAQRFALEQQCKAS